MLEIPSTQEMRKLAVIPRRVELGLSDEAGEHPISLSLPPIEELLEIRNLVSSQVSAAEMADDAGERFQQIFADEFRRMYLRFEKSKSSPTYLTRLASLAELSGDTQTAETFIAEAHRAAPDAFFALKQSSVLFKQRKFDAAFELLTAVPAKGDPNVVLAIALLEIVSGQYDSATPRLSELLRVDPTNFMGRLLSGVVHIVGSRFNQAIRDFRVALEERPHSAVALANLAVAYVCIGQNEKAIRSLREAVNVSPLSKNTVAFLADLAFAIDANNVAIPVLRSYLQYEQKSPAMWSRLARALFKAGRYDDAIDALKQQASLDQSPAVWSNLGVAYSERRDALRAEQYYRFAITQYLDHAAAQWQIAACNLIALLVKQLRYKEAFELSEMAIQGDRSGRLMSDDVLCGVHLNSMTALTHLGKGEKFVERANALLALPQLSVRLRMGLYANLIHYYTLQAPDNEKAVDLARMAIALPDSRLNDGEFGRTQLVMRNNAAFALLEAGLLGDATALLDKLSPWVHKEPHVTATFGYFHLLRGHGARGLGLYREAIRMIQNRQIREQFSQKMVLELGKYYLRVGDKAKALVQLHRAADAKAGLPTLRDEAKSLMRSLRALQ